jgi:hypothetical protein
LPADEQGEQVDLLAVLNCAPPNSGYAKIPWTPTWGLRFARNLLYWANYFGQWSATQRREFFRWKWQSFARKFDQARTSPHGEPSKVEPGDLVDLSSYTEEQKAIWETHIRGLMNFRPRPYLGSVHLFRRSGTPALVLVRRRLWLGRPGERGVKRILVPGAHERILEEPWVKALAQELCGVLHRAQESSNEINGAARSPRPEAIKSASRLNGRRKLILKHRTSRVIR